MASSTEQTKEERLAALNEIDPWFTTPAGAVMSTTLANAKVIGPVTPPFT